MLRVRYVPASQATLPLGCKHCDLVYGAPLSTFKTRISSCRFAVSMLSAELNPLKGREPRKGPPAPHVANGPSSHTPTSELATAQGQGLARLLFASRVQQGYEVQVQVILLATDHATCTRHSCWVTSARKSRGINLCPIKRLQIAGALLTRPASAMLSPSCSAVAVSSVLEAEKLPI